MVQLSKYVRDHFTMMVKKVRAEFPLLKNRLVVARAVDILKKQEAKLKELGSK